ncbi:MAG: SRPBCC family protein [Planctomycetota bacterium]
MADLSLTQTIHAPLERVFQLATDLPRAAEHISGVDRIELLTDGPIGAGTRWRETRTMMGRQATEELEITAFDPPRGYTAECDSCGCHFVSTFAMAEVEGGTEVRLTLATTAQSMVAKLMSPLSALTMGAAKKAIEQDLIDLKQAAEAAPVGGSAAPSTQAGV